MKQYLIQYKPFLLFLSKFFLSYILLTLLYQAYLSQFTTDQMDSITCLVASHTERLLSVFNIDFQVKYYVGEAYLRLIYNQKYVARMIEGCNAISIVILFIAFVVSFSGKLKTTLLFIGFGVFVIYALNIIRIALLCVLIFWYPAKEGLLHGVIFPLSIYGVVFILWLIWVKKYSTYAKSNS
ncbi:exosortase family protein XrtF [Flavobacterium sp.]|uniref:exosortase family protein XrtF n=1 Tax=Flavobacterium sp. TaxID=239 RepID=UPI002614D1D8|nr:exosortase family protein XrtF [Flavobacterium sp.]MDG2432788.1 exosortase family protein XrtF [Flavobacterium sp.]